MLEFLSMCFEFFKAGLFTVGGGLATLPFLTDIAKNHPDWFNLQDLANIVAVAESTPGPMGVNMSTFAGFKTFGVIGGIATTLSLVFPSFVVVIIVSRIWQKYKEDERVKKIFAALRAAAIGLLFSAGVGVFITGVFPGFTGHGLSSLIHGDFISNLSLLAGGFDLKCMILFAVIMVATQIKKVKDLHPVIFIVFGAVVGLIFSF